MISILIHTMDYNSHIAKLIHRVESNMMELIAEHKITALSFKLREVRTLKHNEMRVDILCGYCGFKSKILQDLHCPKCKELRTYQNTLKLLINYGWDVNRDESVYCEECGDRTIQSAMNNGVYCFGCSSYTKYL